MQDVWLAIYLGRKGFKNRAALDRRLIGLEYNNRCYLLPRAALVQPSSWVLRCFTNIVPFVRILEMSYKKLGAKKIS